MFNLLWISFFPVSDELHSHDLLLSVSDYKIDRRFLTYDIKTFLDSRMFDMDNTHVIVDCSQVTTEQLLYMVRE